ncbi:hypothetical protein Tco_0780554, partial [Tanacetum coccineum]
FIFLILRNGGQFEYWKARLVVVVTKERGSFVSFREMIISQLQGKLWLYDELGGVRHRMTWRECILALGLHTDEEMAKAGFRAYWLGSKRVIPNKGDLRDYWIQISSDRDFLELAPSYVFIRDPYLFRHAEGRKSRARLFGGNLIGSLAAHFGLVSDQGLRGLSVVTHELLLIDLHELGRLNICMRVGDTWACVAPGPKRQPDAVALELLRMLLQLMRVLKPQPSTPRTITQRITRLEEEVQDLRWNIVGLRGDIDRSITDQGMFTT